MKKCIGVFLSFSLIACLIAASSSFASDTCDTPLDMVYEVSHDVVPLKFDQPYSSFVFRDGIFYSDRNGYPLSPDNGNLSTILEAMGVATMSDIEAASFTVPDMVDALQEYFSQGQVNSNNLWSILAGYNTNFGLLTRDYLSGFNVDYLNSSGGRTTAINGINLFPMLNQGFLGLGNDLMGSSGSFSYSAWLGGNSSISQYSASSLAQILAQGNSLSAANSTIPLGNLVLQGDGTSYSPTTRWTGATVSNSGFLGLASIMRGSSGNVASFEVLSSSDLDDTSTFEANNLLDAIVGGFSTLQPDIAKLRFTLASDDDIQMREDLSDQYDAIVDDFTKPGGQGTPSVGNIKDTAGVSAGAVSSFDVNATPADMISQLGDDSNYGFLSSQVQDDLNNVYGSTSPALLDDLDDGFIDFLNPHFQDIDRRIGSSW